jgi:GNAT superfamily N-acetyltransferase
MADENAALLIAEFEGHMVGFIHVLIREAPDIPIRVPRRYAVVDNLVVRKRFRRHGAGRSLMEHAHRWALDKKVSHVELNVWEFNKEAFAFYDKLGYETANRRMWKSLGQHVSNGTGRR